jgi:LysR family nod box-dependent transcriptional activator
MRFDRLDLNLLVALDVLLAERSVTVAANRLHLSQSATSSALGRLRDYFGDRLLVNQGRNMVLTERARGLIGPVRDVLDRIRETLVVPAPFDPGACLRTIRIMASDYAVAGFLAASLAELAVRAPGLVFDILPLSDDPEQSLARSQTDLVLLPATAASPRHPRQSLFVDRFVVLGAADNPALQGGISEGTYRRLRHVAAAPSKALIRALREDFAHIGDGRRIDVVGPSYLSLPKLVAGTSRVATIPYRLAKAALPADAFVIHELPFPAPPIHYLAQWSAAQDDDPVLLFVLRYFKE